MSKSSTGGSPLERDTERDLVRQAQQGDEDALEALLTAHQDMVFRTALRFTSGNEESATELAQEVMISVFRHIKKFRAESRFSTWLYRITANLAKNRYVVENRERARYTSLEAKMHNPDDNRVRDFEDERIIDPRDAATGSEQLELLHARVDGLEPEWKEIIILRFFEDLSYEEIAETLELPIGTVKSRINRARKALREAMKDVLDEMMP